MSRIKKGDTSLRIELNDTDKYKNWSESPYEVISCISDDGINIIISSNIDPNPTDITLSYALIIEPVTANITELRDLLRCWILTKSRSAGDDISENGDTYITIYPDVDQLGTPGCYTVIPSASCPYVLQNSGGTLYFNGLPLSGGGGGGFTTAESGVYAPNATTVRLGGAFLEDIYHDAAGFEYFCNNFSTWRVQLGAGDPFAAIICDATRTRISRATGELQIATPNVNGGTANIGDQLVLIDASTGATQFTEYAQNSGEVFNIIATVSYNIPDVSQVRYYFLNTNLSSNTINLPANPRDGRTITVGDRNGNSISFPLIINGNGHNIVDNTGSNITTSIGTPYGVMTFVYNISSFLWYVIRPV